MDDVSYECLLRSVVESRYPRGKASDGVLQMMNNDNVKITDKGHGSVIACYLKDEGMGDGAASASCGAWNRVRIRDTVAPTLRCRKILFPSSKFLANICSAAAWRSGIGTEHP